MQPKVIFVNGPPQSGKDTTALWLKGQFDPRMAYPWGYYAETIKMAMPLKLAAHTLCGDYFGNMDSFELVKDTPQEKLFGKTPRELYIALSETFAKPFFGEDFFGKLFVRDMKRKPHVGIFLCADSGFIPETVAVAQHVGPENCMILRTHREGYDYKGDSRGYIAIVGITDHDVYDCKNEESKRELRAAVDAWLKCPQKV